MAAYTPDRWLLVKLSPVDGSPEHHRIFASWSGGYTTGDSWKLSSGNLPAFDTGQTWLVPQASGSEYILGKTSYGSSFYTQGVLNKLIKNSEDSVIITVLKQPETEKEFLP